MPPRELRRWIWDAGRVPAERTTTYQLRRTFADRSDDPFEPLDEAAQHPERFGSYFELIQMDKFRFRDTYASYRSKDDQTAESLVGPLAAPAAPAVSSSRRG